MRTHDHLRLPALVLLLGLTALGGCGDDDPTDPTPRTYTRTHDAQFAVRTGSRIDPTGIPGIFDAGQDEAMLEFPLDFPSAAKATVHVRVKDFIYSPSDPPGLFSVSTYAADGQASTSDYGAGTYLDSFAMQAGELKSCAIDVTERASEMKAAGATHIGLRFHGSTLAQLSVQSDAELVAGP